MGQRGLRPGNIRMMMSCCCCCQRRRHKRMDTDGDPPQMRSLGVSTIAPIHSGYCECEGRAAGSNAFWPHLNKLLLLSML